jgi:hypothetical protein
MKPAWRVVEEPVRRYSGGLLDLRPAAASRNAMTRQLARELKAAGFPIKYFQVGHRFYPHENSLEWTEAAREQGVTVTAYQLQHHLQDIKDGYYCPTLPDLIEASGQSFARLYVVTATWIAESENPQNSAAGETPEEAVARLWLLLNKKVEQGAAGSC